MSIFGALACPNFFNASIVIPRQGVYTAVPNSTIVIICVGSMAWIMIEIEVSQPNDFLQYHQHDNQELSVHEAEEKY